MVCDFVKSGEQCSLLICIVGTWRALVEQSSQTGIAPNAVLRDFYSNSVSCISAALPNSCDSLSDNNVISVHDINTSEKKKVFKNCDGGKNKSVNCVLSCPRSCRKSEPEIPSLFFLSLHWDRLDLNTEGSVQNFRVT